MVIVCSVQGSAMFRTNLTTFLMGFFIIHSSKLFDVEKCQRFRKMLKIVEKKSKKAMSKKCPKMSKYVQKSKFSKIVEEMSKFLKFTESK